MIKIPVQERKAKAVLDENDQPVKIVVDTFKVILIRVDHYSKTLEVSGMYGHMSGSEFVPHVEQNGSMNIFSQVIAQDTDDKKDFTDFMMKVEAAGAPPGNCRIEDIEELLLEKGLIKGTKV